MKRKSLLQYQWKKNRAVFFCGFFYVPTGILAGLLRIYLPKAVLSELETTQTVAHMGMTLLVISVALLLLLLVQTRLDVSISRYGYLLLQEMRGEYARRLLNANYEEMETQNFRSARDQAKQAIYGGRMDGKNITPVNDFMKNLLSALTNMGSVLLYTVMIARVSPILIPVLLLPPMLIFYLDGKVGVWEEKENWDAYQKEDYTRERAGDFTYAKDIRLYNMKPWLLGMNQKYAGIRLGLKKELALARALYQDRPVLILDEPTAALDPLAEYEMYQRYADFAKDKLSFFVSHRLSSTRFCTRILLLQDGCFAEQGTHEELLKKNGVYAELFRLQSYYYNREKEGTV